MSSSKLVLLFAVLAIFALVAVSDAQYLYGAYGYPSSYYGSSYYGYGGYAYPGYYGVYGKREAGFTPQQ